MHKGNLSFFTDDLRSVGAGGRGELKIVAHVASIAFTSLKGRT
jgi:hypothetical protein